MSSDYKQLLLFDCDGGRASLFDDKTILSQLPSNCHCYLFWNDNDENLSEKLQYLKKFSRIHCYPVLTKNSKNATDGKLIYFLGKLVAFYSFIVIVHGGDGIYEEVIRSVSEEYDKDKIVGEVTVASSSTYLKELFKILKQRNEQHDYIDSKLPDNVYMDEIIDKSNNRCLICSRRCKNITGLYQHFPDKHQLNVKIICACKLEFEELKDFHRHQKEKQNHAIGNQGVVTCLATSDPTQVHLDPYPLLLVIKVDEPNKCVFYKCDGLTFKPQALITHLSTKHRGYVNVTLQCCNNIKYTLDDFRYHIGSQHKIINIKKCGF